MNLGRVTDRGDPAPLAARQGDSTCTGAYLDPANAGDGIRGATGAGRGAEAQAGVGKPFVPRRRVFAQLPRVGGGLQGCPRGAAVLVDLQRGREPPGTGTRCRVNDVQPADGASASGELLLGRGTASSRRSTSVEPAQAIVGVHLARGVAAGLSGAPVDDPAVARTSVSELEAGRSGGTRR